MLAEARSCSATGRMQGTFLRRFPKKTRRFLPSEDDHKWYTRGGARGGELTSKSSLHTLTSKIRSRRGATEVMLLVTVLDKMRGD